MNENQKRKTKKEFGDFQTPYAFAQEICSFLEKKGYKPSSAIEPTCGLGSFFLASLNGFPSLKKIVGLDINRNHVSSLESALKESLASTKACVIHGNFFETDWPAILNDLPDPLLIIGNPPWVTNAQLGSLGSSNLPQKSNFQKHRGLDALTGKSNFDISEWMMIQILNWIDNRNATLAMLCKTGVARKVLLHAWKNNIRISTADIYKIDALRHFEAAVDACLLVVSSSGNAHLYDCNVHESLTAKKPDSVFGYRESRLVADVPSFERWKKLEGKEHYKWRSGIKHDCSKVMEFTKDGSAYRNGLGEVANFEDNYLYPMFKSSEVAKKTDGNPSRWMLVTQQFVGEDTCIIEEKAPKTWAYLLKHDHLLKQRGSIIYKGRPPFSVFGVGEYSFAPWKVAISGFYKKVAFKVIGPAFGKPVVLDDTCYFLPCQTKEEALYIGSLLNSEIAQEFFQAFIFWDAKRPITIDVLKRLDLLTLAQEVGSEEKLRKHLCMDQLINFKPPSAAPSLFSESQSARVTA